MNMQDMIFHADNLTNDQVTFILQLPQKCLSNKKPYTEQAKMKLDQLIELNPQFHLDTNTIHDKDVLVFNSWLWDQLVGQLKLYIRNHVVNLINERLDSSGSSLSCSFDAFLS